jgi:hypothetical protein
MLTKEFVETFHQEINDAIDAIAAKHGLKRSGGRITYYPDDGFLKLNDCQFGEIASLGDIRPALIEDTNKHGWRWGFTKSDCGNTTFANMGTDYLFYGMKGKDKVAAKNKTDGKVYLFKADAVARVLQRTA